MKHLFLTVFVTACLSSYAQISFEYEYNAELRNRHAATIELADSSIVILGHSGHVVFGDMTPFIVKLNKYGDTLWTKKIITPSLRVWAGILDHDKGFAFAGCQGDNYYFLKTDSLGNIVMQKKWGTSGQHSSAGSILRTDSSYVLVGNHFPISSGSGGFVEIMQLDLSGNLNWSTELSGYCGSCSINHSISRSITGDYLVGVHKYGEGRVLKIDSLGNIVLDKVIAYSGVPVQTHVETPDSGFITLGGLGMIKFDKYGNQQWSNPNYVGSNLFINSSGGLSFKGLKNDWTLGEQNKYHSFIIRTDINGSYIDAHEFYVNSSPSGGELLDLSETLDNGYLLTFKTTYSGSHSNYAIYVIKTRKDKLFFTSLIEHDLKPKLQIYPNPFTNSATIEFQNSDNKSYVLRIYDQNGRLMYSEYNITNNKIQIERKQLSSGMYFFQLVSPHGESLSGKLNIE